jgi:catalase-peroxidase
MDVPTQSFIWLANNPAELRDLIVLGGSAGIEEGARQAGAAIKMPVTPGCVDASQGQTDAVSFAPLEPRADRFRNFYQQESRLSPAEMLLDLPVPAVPVPEMTVLVGGMRALNANTGGSANGALTVHPGSPTNDFFVNLFDMPTGRSKSATSEGLFEVHGRTSGALKWTATPVDRVFGSNSELRAVAEVSASDDGKEEFMRDFVSAWTAVMTSRVLECSNAAGEVTKASGLCTPILPVEDEEIEVNHDCY